MSSGSKMTDAAEAEDAAIRTLMWKRHELTEGLNSISEQETSIEERTESLEAAVRKLAFDKKALLEIDHALAILKAGS